MADEHHDDLVASKTEGFKVGEKKTLEEYNKLGMIGHFSLRLLIFGKLFFLSICIGLNMALSQSIHDNGNYLYHVRGNLNRIHARLPATYHVYKNELTQQRI